MIQGLTADDQAAGQKIYAQNCASCHGADGNLTLNPLARSFVRDELKFGADPYSLWKTVSYGNGLMFRYDSVLSEKERYQVVHYVREAFIRQNPKQSAALTADYFAKLPAVAATDARKHAPAMQTVDVPPGMIDGKMGQQMIYGPAQSHSIVLRKAKEDQNTGRTPGTTERGLVVALPGGAVICYDVARLSVAGLWTGGLLDTARSHHTSYKGQQGLAPAHAPSYLDVGAEGWRMGAPQGRSAAGLVQFKGYYLHGEQVMLTYAVGGRNVLELPGALPARPVLSRAFEVAAGKAPLFCLIGRIAGGKLSATVGAASFVGTEQTLHVTLTGNAKGTEFVSDAQGGLWLGVPADSAARQFTVWYGFQQAISAEALPATPELASLTRGGARRWAQPVSTRMIRGESIEGYAADELTVPFANPWGSWMRLSALDFFADGRIAVSTLSGDVWIVTPGASNPDELSWSRFANGLYEPLGLRIVDGVIHVRCRDRIVRLRDVNGDGEADYYETFYNEPGEIGSGYHAFIFELQTDKAGNFYYSKSGRKSPHKAAVVRISPDGQRSEIVATDMRHPNGMGAGGPHDWVTVSDNPSGKAIYNGFSLVRDGASYGYEQARNVPMVAALPAAVDASSTGQSWSDPKRWGPLGGSILHTSYSHCAMFYVMVQDVSPFPNGFAIRLPFDFKAGLMRSRVNPVDGQVYAVGLKGWDTKAGFDGCLYRIRYTGGVSHLIENVVATTAGLRLTLSCDIDPASVQAGSVTAVREQGKKGETAPEALGAVTLTGRRSVEVAMPAIEAERLEHRTRIEPKTGASVVDVRNPLIFTVKLKAADGTPIHQTVYATINSLP